MSSSLSQKLIEKLALAVLTALTSVVVERIPGLVKKVSVWWRGKSLAVIGPTASGKNTLFHKLQHQTPPAEHIQTRGAEAIATFNVNWPMPDKSTVEFRCKGSINVGGEVDERDRYWLQSCKDADVIFYLVDVIKLTEAPKETLDRIKSDLKWLATNIRHFKPSSCIHILVNKIDFLVEDIEPEEIADTIREKAGNVLEMLKELIDRIMQGHKGRVSGVGAISMTDDHLFGLLFTDALIDVTKAELVST
jgi:energy-coupling factor transporter ATP-binding protein EcfA2